MRLLLSLLVISFMASCATIIHGKRDSHLVFECNAPPHRVTLKNLRTQNEQQIDPNTTVTVALSGKYRFFKRSKYEITFLKSGYEPVSYKLTPKITFWYWLNIPLGGIWMVTVDPATGAMYQYKHKKYSVHF